MPKQPTNQLPLLSWLTPPSTQVSHFIAADDQLVIANGVNLSYKPGTMYKDTGYSTTGTMTGLIGTPLSLMPYARNPFSTRYLATGDSGSNTALLYNDNPNTGLNAWAAISGTSAWNGFTGQLVEGADYLGLHFMVGATAGATPTFLPPRTLNGTTFGTSMTTDMPRGRYIVRYKDRLYVLHVNDGSTTYPYRVVYSNIPSGGSVTWTPATNFFDVDFGDQITGGGTAFNRLMIFTKRSAWAYDGTILMDMGWPGCDNHRSIQVADGYIVYANRDGVWAGTGGRPQNIGNDIIDLVRNSDSTKWRSWWANREYNLYLGNTSSNGINYDNCVVSMSFQTGMWRWRELYNTMYSACASGWNEQYQFGLLGAASSGTSWIYRKAASYDDPNISFSDNTKAISGWFRTKAYDMGLPANRKSVKKFFAYAQDAQGLQLGFRSFDKNREQLMPFTPIGQLKDTVTLFNKHLSGYFIQFEGKEYSALQPFKFYGLNVIWDVDSDPE